jgi:hypothetical protein
LMTRVIKFMLAVIVIQLRKKGTTLLGPVPGSMS